MRLRIPLFAQTALVLLTNIALIALILLAPFNSAFQFSAEDFIFGPAARTLHKMVFALERQLILAPATNWDSILSEYSQFYGVTLRLLDQSGRKIAGPGGDLPPEVTLAAARLLTPHGNFHSEPPETALGKHPWPTIPHFFLRTSNPDLFWIGILMPFPPPSAVAIPEPRLLMRPGRKGGTLLCSTANFWQSSLAEEVRNNVLTISLIVIATLLIWYLFVYRITKSITSLRDTTRVIAGGHFDAVGKPSTITEIEELNQDILAMSSQIREHLNGQKRFLADIAHELCSPLARLQVAIELLVQDSDDAKRDLVADIREEVEQMSSLLNELLAFSKAAITGVGREDLVVVNVCQLLRLALEKQKVDAKTDFEEGDLFCQGDEVLLSRAFGNILRNSLRYAGTANPVEVSVKRGHGQLLVAIADHGPGVPAESLPKLGQPFYRPEAARTRETGGIGLGLAIVRSCVEACNGGLSVRNRVPHGLVVEITLPCDDEGTRAGALND
ncbi:MAG: HAMP domain-containing histidine kinase [Candidatus Obscuribacterales bacterium]|nr:HAMP domain-containing histidine kinase [Candidatus Obscuribacterales bacterium]